MRLDVRIQEFHVHLHIHDDDAGLIKKIENIGKEVDKDTDDLKSQIPNDQTTTT